MYNNLLISLLALLLASAPAFAQTTAKQGSNKLTINRAKTLDFKPDMVKLLEVPKGWEVSIAASGLGKPRMLYGGNNGELYITRRDPGDVLILKDKDGDQKFEEQATIVSNFKGVHGITIKDGWMYLCNNSSLRRYKVNNDGSLGVLETLMDDLPAAGQHPNRTIDFGPDGMLYLSVGSACNACKEPEELATILQVDPKTWKRTVFAAGLRNTIGFDWHPATGELWGLDNGGDGKGNDWPPEELNRLIKGGHYGFPFAYGKKEADKTFKDLPGTTKEAFVNTTQASVLEMQAHMAPIAFQFFNNVKNIPAEYNNDGLVCWHGSWNRKKSVGYKVQRIKFKNGVAVGIEDFVTGFLRPGTGRKQKHFGRPAGLTITPEGIVFISDDANGVLYAVKKSSK